MDKKKQYIVPATAVVVMEQLMVTGASIESSTSSVSSLSWEESESEGTDASEAW